MRLCVNSEYGLNRYLDGISTLAFVRKCGLYMKFFKIWPEPLSDRDLQAGLTLGSVPARRTLKMRDLSYNKEIFCILFSPV